MEIVKKNVVTFLKEYAYEEPDTLFLFDEDSDYTVKGTYQYVMALAKSMKDNGVKKGDNIGITAYRNKETFAIFYASQVLGAVAVLCDPRYEPKEYVKAMEVPLSLDKEIKYVDNKWLLNDQELPIYKPEIEYEELEIFSEVEKGSIIIFTSGSTGRAKGVILSEYNLVNHVRNLHPVMGYTEKDSAIQMLPSFHAFGLAVIFDCVVYRCPVFFPKEITPNYICEMIEKYRFTRFGFVPSFALGMAKAKEEHHYDTSSLAVAVIGGAPTSKEQFQYIQNTLGVTILPAYGLSECIGISQCGEWESDEDRRNSVGKCLSMNDIKITPEGEITVKGPAVFLGYVGEKPFDHNEYFHTGDLGFIDEKGFLHITGRLKDIIIRNGNNISVNYLEKQLLSLPFILEATVVGVPDSKVGEVPAALVVLRKGGVYNKEAVNALFNKLEMPKEVRIVESIPLTASGKPDKGKIKEMF